MRYRDDHEAQRIRAANLEEQLREAERRLADAEHRIAAHEHKDVNDERQLAQLRAAVASLQPPAGAARPAARKATLTATLVAIIALTVAGAVAYMAVRPSAAPPEVDSAVETAPSAVAAPPPVSAAPPATKPDDYALFGAEVVAQQGDRVAVGDHCILRAQLTTRGNKSFVGLSCGETWLYRTSDERGSGTQRYESTLREEPATIAGAFVYVLRYADVGEHSGPRAELDVDTTRHRARAFRSGADAWSVTLHISDTSFPRWGAPLSTDAASRQQPFARRVHLLATPSERSGPLPAGLERATNCELVVAPVAHPGHNCRILLRCGSVIVYGADTAGYNACTLSDRAPMAANDTQRSSEDTDPVMRLDLAARTMVVEDGALGAEWRIALSLSAPATCGLDGRFTGVAIDPEGQATEVALSLGKSVELTWLRGGERHSAALEPAACGDGPVTSSRGDTRLQIEAGPGWGTIGGRVSGALSGPIAAMKPR